MASRRHRFLSVTVLPLEVPAFSWAHDDPLSGCQRFEQGEWLRTPIHGMKRRWSVANTSDGYCESPFNVVPKTRRFVTGIPPKSKSFGKKEVYRASNTR